MYWALICTAALKVCALISQQVDEGLEIKAYYAGHVLGAAMFRVSVGTQSFVYTVSDICDQTCSYLSCTSCTNRATTT